MHAADIQRIHDDYETIDRLREWEIAAREQRYRRLKFWTWIGALVFCATVWGFALHFLLPGPS